MQRTLPERNINLVELPTDAHRLMMQFLSFQDLIRLKGTNRLFRQRVKTYLEPQKPDSAEHQKNIRLHSLLQSSLKKNQLNDFIENEQNKLFYKNPAKAMMIFSASAATCILLGFLLQQQHAARNTLFVTGAILLTTAIIIGMQYAIINRRIHLAHHQLNLMFDIEAGISHRPC